MAAGPAASRTGLSGVPRDTQRSIRAIVGILKVSDGAAIPVAELALPDVEAWDMDILVGFVSTPKPGGNRNDFIVHGTFFLFRFGHVIHRNVTPISLPAPM